MSCNLKLEEYAMVTNDSQTKKNPRRYLAWAMYTLGLLVGLWLAGQLIWANIEAAQFDTLFTREAMLEGLSCPAIIVRGETGRMQVTLENEAERPLNFAVRANVSNGMVTLIRQERETVTLQPGEAQDLEWTVNAEDAAFDRFVLVRVHVLRNLPYPYRQGVCGIVVLDAPIKSGQTVLALALLTSVVGMAGGLYWRWRIERPLTGSKRSTTIIAIAAAVIVLLLIIVGLLRLWAIGLLLIAVSFILLGVLLERLGHSRLGG
jgi:hypothetical protein